MSASERPQNPQVRLPRYGDRLELTLERLDDVGRGEGVVARGEPGECTVRVRGGLPGARVAVEVLGRRKRAVDGRVTEVLAPAPDTVLARCAHFGPCGGCAFQHLAYPAQLAAKRTRVEAALAGVLPTGVAVEPALGMADPWRYRNKLDFTFGSRRWRVEGEAPVEEGVEEADFALGLHVPGVWSKVLDVDACAIAFEGADALLATTKRLARRHGLAPWDVRLHTGLLRHLVLRRGVRTGETMLVLVTSQRAAHLVDPLARDLLAAHPELTTLVQDVNDRHAAVAIGQEQFVLHGAGTIEERLLGRSFTLSPHSFFQTNTLQAERLMEIVREEAALAPGGVLWDLYCGAGTIGLCLADPGATVVGFESVGPAVADARANAARNGLAAATFVEGDVLATLAAAAQDPRLARARPDVVVLDPPRAGLHPKVTPAVAALGAPRIVYVSCHPDSAARDLAQLALGGYRIERVRPVDLFPHTPHVETVIRLGRTEASRP